MPETRRRHYILSLQLASTLPVPQSTCTGVLEGDDDEQCAFEIILADRCALLSQRSGRDWNAQNTTVLFYRLVDLP